MPAVKVCLASSAYELVYPYLYGLNMSLGLELDCITISLQPLACTTE